jgi:hypothetical protein
VVSVRAAGGPAVQQERPNLLVCLRGMRCGSSRQASRSCRSGAVDRDVGRRRRRGERSGRDGEFRRRQNSGRPQASGARRPWPARARASSTAKRLGTSLQASGGRRLDRHVSAGPVLGSRDDLTGRGVRRAQSRKDRAAAGYGPSRDSAPSSFMLPRPIADRRPPADRRRARRAVSPESALRAAWWSTSRRERACPGGAITAGGRGALSRAASLAPAKRDAVSAVLAFHAGALPCGADRDTA